MAYLLTASDIATLMSTSGLFSESEVANIGTVSDAASISANDGTYSLTSLTTTGACLSDDELIAKLSSISTITYSDDKKWVYAAKKSNDNTKSGTFTFPGTEKTNDFICIDNNQVSITTTSLEKPTISITTFANNISNIHVTRTYDLKGYTFDKIVWEADINDNTNTAYKFSTSAEEADKRLTASEVPNNGCVITYPAGVNSSNNAEIFVKQPVVSVKATLYYKDDNGNTYNDVYDTKHECFKDYTSYYDESILELTLSPNNIGCYPRMVFIDASTINNTTDSKKNLSAANYKNFLPTNSSKEYIGIPPYSSSNCFTSEMYSMTSAAALSLIHSSKDNETYTLHYSKEDLESLSSTTSYYIGFMVRLSPYKNDDGANTNSNIYGIASASLSSGSKLLGSFKLYSDTGTANSITTLSATSSTQRDIASGVPIWYLDKKFSLSALKSAKLKVDMTQYMPKYTHNFPSSIFLRTTSSPSYYHLMLDSTVTAFIRYPNGGSYENGDNYMWAAAKYSISSVGAAGGNSQLELGSRQAVIIYENTASSIALRIHYSDSDSDSKSYVKTSSVPQGYSILHYDGDDFKTISIKGIDNNYSTDFSSAGNFHFRFDEDKRIVKFSKVSMVPY